MNGIRLKKRIDHEKWDKRNEWLSLGINLNKEKWIRRLEKKNVHVWEATTSYTFYEWLFFPAWLFVNFGRIQLDQFKMQQIFGRISSV